jgi:hypothetical protein
MAAVFDHLVVVCADLDQGAEWIQSTLGVTVLPGGRHVAMGTHNRLLRLGPRGYLEVIAIDPDAPPPDRPRWFGLDDPDTRTRAAVEPFIATWVVRTTDISAALNRVPELGEILALSRGPYRWRIAVPANGRLPFDGVLPAVIQWDGDAHPAYALPDQGLALGDVTLRHPRADDLQPLLDRLGLSVPVAAGYPSLSMLLHRSMDR